MQQPVHTVYGGANLFKANTAVKLGALAKRAFDQFASSAEDFSAFGAPVLVQERVARKLELVAVEDFRIDFEDGYGYRSDEEEDAAAHNAAEQIRIGANEGTLPPLLGIRIKPFTPLARERARRTLGLFLDSAKQLPKGFVVTLPKVTTTEQVEELLAACGLDIEIMIETPQALRSARELVAAAKGRCRGAHFGPYDYMSSLGISNTSRGLAHPACEFARSTMLVELADAGVWLSDGPTSTIPVPPRETMMAAWKLHYANVSRALENGYYQGWDLHPAHFVARYAAVYAFFLDGLTNATTRLRNFVNEAGQATRIGAIFDDAATAEGLLLYVKRSISCGAVAVEEASAATGLSVEELQLTSFVHIMQARKS